MAEIIPYDLARRAPQHDATVVSLRAGAARVRHQRATPFELSYAGDRTMILYVFERRDRRLREACRTGTFTILRPGEPLDIRSEDAMEVLAIAYDTESAASGHGTRCGAVDAGVRTLALEIRRMLRGEANPDLAYLAALAEALRLRADRVAALARPFSTTAALVPAKVRRIRAFVEANLDRAIKVEELAGQVGLSRAHFTRAFAAATGLSPHRFILVERIEAVKSALRGGGNDLSVIAARSGFSSHAHMTAAFRNVEGITPSEWRRRLEPPAGQSGTWTIDDDAPRRVAGARR